MTWFFSPFLRLPFQEREQMQRYNQRMMEQQKIRQQQERGRLPKIQRSEGKTRMAMYKKSLHISSSGSASEQREKIKQVNLAEREVKTLLKAFDYRALIATSGVSIKYHHWLMKSRLIRCTQSVTFSTVLEHKSPAWSNQSHTVNSQLLLGCRTCRAWGQSLALAKVTRPRPLTDVC